MLGMWTLKFGIKLIFHEQKQPAARGRTGQGVPFFSLITHRQQKYLKTGKTHSQIKDLNAIWTVQMHVNIGIVNIVLSN